MFNCSKCHKEIYCPSCAGAFTGVMAAAEWVRFAEHMLKVANENLEWQADELALRAAEAMKESESNG